MSSDLIELVTKAVLAGSEGQVVWPEFAVGGPARVREAGQGFGGSVKL